MTIRVAIVDDQQLMREAFAMILEAQTDIEVVGDAEHGRTGVDLCRRTRPDVVLMDIRMPEMDGLEATGIIAAADSIETRVLMLTTFDRDEYVYDAIRAGASGFLLKDTPAKQLVEAVRIIASGEALLAPSVTRSLIEEFARHPGPHAAPALPEELTEREMEALLLLAREMNNREIAEAMYIGEATAKTHVSRSAPPSSKPCSTSSTPTSRPRPTSSSSPTTSSAGSPAITGGRASPAARPTRSSP